SIRVALSGAARRPERWSGRGVALLNPRWTMVLGLPGHASLQLRQNDAPRGAHQRRARCTSKTVLRRQCKSIRMEPPMTSAAPHRPLAWLPVLTPVAAGAAILLALLALAGWTVDSEWLKRLNPHGPAMNPLTAAALILAATALLLVGPHVPAALRPAARFCR